MLLSSRIDRVTCVQDSHLTLNNAVEVIGKVNPDLTVKVLSATDFGNNLGRYKAIVDKLWLPACFLIS